MSAYEILSEALKSDTELYKRTFDDNLDVLKEMMIQISKVLLMLYKKGLITEKDIEECLSKNEIDKTIDETVNRKMKELGWNNE